MPTNHIDKPQKPDKITDRACFTTSPRTDDRGSDALICTCACRHQSRHQKPFQVDRETQHCTSSASEPGCARISHAPLHVPPKAPTLMCTGPSFYRGGTLLERLHASSSFFFPGPTRNSVFDNARTHASVPCGDIMSDNIICPLTPARRRPRLRPVCSIWLACPAGRSVETRIILSFFVSFSRN